MYGLRAFLPKLHNLKHLELQLRNYAEFKTKLYIKSSLIKSIDHIDDLIKKYASRVIYNSVIEKRLFKYETRKQLKSESAVGLEEPIPLSLKYLYDDVHVNEAELEACASEEVINFPYERRFAVSMEHGPGEAAREDFSLDFASEANEEVRTRQKLLEAQNWMTEYDNYDDSLLGGDDTWQVNYGTPDFNSEISQTPCGGCGALLHCKDTSIPGYVPSEIYHNSFVEGGTSLKGITCQRCHFLKHYNLALQVQVSSDDYPKVLQTISQRQGLVVLMVDLMDFPCSIWPGIGEIFGPKTPLVIVGNKVDLLPQDSEKYLARIKNILVDTIKLQGFATFNIRDVVLISAKTGFGIEELITKLGSLYRLNGNVYIVGSTNVGKSSLFNVFLQSDYCKIQAIDLIQRATTSVWPGTTLNLLKFPIKRPAGFRQYLRFKRLQQLQKIQADEAQLRKEQLRVTKDPKYATLIGHIDITKNPHSKELANESPDIFNQQGIKVRKMGINEKSPEFAFSKWCFDTPGVVQRDQIVHLLTTEELLLTLPKQLIVPRNFCVKPGSALFIAGLARLDFVKGPGSVRLTVFAANELPITVCDTVDADGLYEELLGTALLKVPQSGKDRLSKWPKLDMGLHFKVVGDKWKKSAIDVVLSSAGWISVAGREGLEYEFDAWTPEKRGIYLRDCLLPHAVSLFGKRIKHSVAYNNFNFYLK